eukprot:CAMPEP_0174890604 /NCGR_PEP_ID=MMETSP0167-20121228/5738_1 /TAXON_ID=38298 /ORGANISM="Rhodella maculata, Strain CCMP736" /LENGTH=141 /DNA_ID=CAMNT_0016128459 /DNA_START=235 /DNA_END=661 /DNA_ORIENTATION=-
MTQQASGPGGVLQLVAIRISGSMPFDIAQPLKHGAWKTFSSAGSGGAFPNRYWQEKSDTSGSIHRSSPMLSLKNSCVGVLHPFRQMDRHPDSSKYRHRSTLSPSPSSLISLGPISHFVHTEENHAVMRAEVSGNGRLTSAA